MNDPLWKVTLKTDDEPSTYLAAIGGYSPANKDVSTTEYYSGLYDFKTLEEASVNTLFNETLRRLQ